MASAKHYLRPNGRTFHVRIKWKEGTHRKEQRASLHTSDAGLAAKYADQISRILNGEKVDDLALVVKTILNIRDPLAEVVDAGVLAASELANLAGYRDHLPSGLRKQAEDNEQVLLEISCKLKAESDARRLAEKQRDNLQQEIDGLKSTLRAAGRLHAAKMQPKTLKQATDEYMLSTTALPRTRKEYRGIFKHLSSAIGQDTLIQEVTPERLIDYFTGLKEETPEYTRKRCTMIRALLLNATAKDYPFDRVKEWVMDNTKIRKKTADDYLWLSLADVHNLLNNAQSEYWRDAMTMQFWCGLRPEELPMLRADKIERGEQPVIFVSPVPNPEAKSELRALKTQPSMDRVPIAPEALPSFERRAERAAKLGTLLLFPYDRGTPQKPGEVPVWRRRKIKEWDGYAGQIMLWPVDPWNKRYAAALRESAGKAGIDKKRIDGRTLRRSRGRDLILKKNRPEQVAAFLRDNLQTVLTYYSRWIPTDITNL